MPMVLHYADQEGFLSVYDDFIVHTEEEIRNILATVAHIYVIDAATKSERRVKYANEEETTR